LLLAEIIIRLWNTNEANKEWWQAPLMEVYYEKALHFYNVGSADEVTFLFNIIG